MAEHVAIPMEPVGADRPAGAHDTHQQDANRHAVMLEKTPAPIYRHAAPSGPWPWMDFDEDIPSVPVPPRRGENVETHQWFEYPQNLFPNWTKTQVDRCKMLTDCPVGESKVFRVDVHKDGTYGYAGDHTTVHDNDDSRAEFWELVNQEREEGIRVRAIFVRNMTKEVMQMLGTRHIVEPFFFSSSTNWIPSRYQESLVQKEDERSDHITVVLPFIRVVTLGCEGPTTLTLQPHPRHSSVEEDEQVIDTQSPLYLESCQKYVLQDLLSVHMVRKVKSSTIISFHPKQRLKTAEQLYTLINRTGRSVYWQKIFKKSRDPTCLLLCYLWYAMYAWDEVFEVLYTHINHLEQKVLSSEDIKETRDLHILQAHLLYYRTLLDDFTKSVSFVQNTENPTMKDPSITPKQREDSQRTLKNETNYLLSEIERLESQRSMQVMRLKNVMDLAFATVNIEDSRSMKDLTIATVRDSAAMKQISYLTMVFLPANFMSNVFSMNVVEINPQGGETLAHYVEGLVLLTAFAVWVVIALQVESRFFPPGCSMWRRASWPAHYVWDMMFSQKFLVQTTHGSFQNWWPFRRRAAR